MDDGSRKTLSTIAALAFLGIMGALLARPVFESDEGSRPPVLPEPTRKEQTDATESPSPEPEATKVETKEAGGLSAPFPRSCLSKLLPELGLGRVAVAAYGRPGTKNKVTIAPLAGGPSQTFAAEAPLEWSASGGFLATRGPQLWSSRGDLLPISPSPQDAPWAWSPLSDCLVTYVRDDLVVLEPAADSSTVLLEDTKPEGLRFSDRGRHLMVGRDVYDLASGDAVKNAPMSALGLGTPRRFAHDTYCTELGASYEHETCSWNGRLVAAVRSGRLILSAPGGGSAEPLTTDTGYRDAFPTWGPRRTGILFVRRPDSGGPAEIWFIPEGGRARDTGMRSVDIEPGGGDWSIYVDWNVDRPLGMDPPVPGS